MVDRDSPVTEEDLHSYVDGELSADRSEAVVAWLAAHPDQAAMVASWRAQADSIRARYAGIAGEPVPDRFKLEKLQRFGRSAGRGWFAVAAAASVAAFIFGAGTGWFARGVSASSPSAFEMLTSDAMQAYKLYVVEVRHPVEVPGDERVHMTQWLSKRLGTALAIPDLQSVGLKLVGGRLLPGPTGAAAAFYMYEGPSGERFTIYCAKAASPETALHYRDEDRLAAFYWVDGQIAYVVSGPSDRERLEQITKAVYEQVDHSSARKL
jgi:anti-sigma factor RsiW